MSKYVNGVILQTFHWFLDPNAELYAGLSQAAFLARKADDWRSLGIDAVWLPPPCQGVRRGGSVGHGVHDHFHLGEFDDQGTAATKYAAEAALHAALDALHGYPDLGHALVRIPGKGCIQVHADAVLDQPLGGALEPELSDAVRAESGHRALEPWWKGLESGPIGIRADTVFEYSARRGAHPRFEGCARHFDNVDTVAEIAQPRLAFHARR